jgi:hypothetical protein
LAHLGFEAEATAESWRHTQSSRLRPPGQRSGQLERKPLEGVEMKTVLAAIMTLLLCSAETVAETFDTSDGFSVTLPSGWAEAPPGALRNLEAAIGKMSQGAEENQYDYGYQLASASRWFEYPYILVQVNRDGRIPEGQLRQHKRIESEFRQGLEDAEEAFGGAVSDTRQDETLYDETDHVLWSALKMKIQGVGDVRGLMAIKLTEFGFIRLMGYATEETFAHYSPIFSEAIRTLAIADEYRYRHRLTDHAPTIWGINLGQVAIAGLIGGLAGGALALIGYLKKKKDRHEVGDRP